VPHHAADAVLASAATQHASSSTLVLQRMIAHTLTLLTPRYFPWIMALFR
jgi:hypothetical protein